MNVHRQSEKMNDPFLRNYDGAEVAIAAEFLSNWLPFLSRGLCKCCTQTLSDGIQSLHTGNIRASTPDKCKENGGHCEDDDDINDCADTHSLGSWKDVDDGGHCADDDDYNNDCADDTNSLGSWKDVDDGVYDKSVEVSPTIQTLSSSAPLASTVSKKSWADIAQEDELASEQENEVSSRIVDVNVYSVEGTSMNEAKAKVAVSSDQREYIRFNSLQRKKDFICLERVGGKLVNILDGLELHKEVFTAAEQAKIVEYVDLLREMGRNGKLKERTYTAPQKWMRGKGRITLQFGCCYNYAPDKNHNPPGILRNEMVDPLPHLFKVMIKRLVRWRVLPPSCVPDSCIVNIYEEGDCIPPHIDNHDFLRPFCTVSFLTECEILFGSNLKIVAPGEFSGYAIPLPVGSVLVINGNGADVAKHCVPAVPSKRISITFRKMDKSKWPSGHVPEADLQGLQPLLDDVDRSKKYTSSSRDRHFTSNPAVVGRENRVHRGRGPPWARSLGSHYSTRIVQGPVNRRNFPA